MWARKGNSRALYAGMCSILGAKKGTAEEGWSRENENREAAWTLETSQAHSGIHSINKGSTNIGHKTWKGMRACRTHSTNSKSE